MMTAIEKKNFSFSEIIFALNQHIVHCRRAVSLFWNSNSSNTALQVQNYFQRSGIISNWAESHFLYLLSVNSMASFSLIDFFSLHSFCKFYLDPIHCCSIFTRIDSVCVCSLWKVSEFTHLYFTAKLLFLCENYSWARKMSAHRLS